ncbi:hypothetical protein EV127DRAFT_450603 [Xylaria flabelliformis]|nr:hypothetical protein EV127DRAFT_450603 [Xylaria flabelliformis]
MELWVFDRSGAFSSGVFNIHEICERSRWLLSEEGQKGNNTRTTIFILKEAIIQPGAIVCRGTTCYITEDRNVVKFSWGSTKREPEVKHLKLAAKRGVQGVAQLVAHYEVTSTQANRKGLKFTNRYVFRDNDSPLSTAGASTLNNKRKLTSTSNHKASQAKRQRTATGRKSKLANEVNDQSLVSNPLNTDLWENRNCHCLVIKSAGRVISKFTTLKELLEALRDAIKAHRSLYIDGRILHHDISCNNIIITDLAEGFYGMLIDLDLAKDHDDHKASGAQHQIGALLLMAIEILQNVDHTYRHDLESFFYVLIWTNGFGGDGETPTESMLNKWVTGSFEDIARAKESIMAKALFKEILNEFPKALESVKGLCESIRDILFPFDKNCVMTKGAPAGDPDILYMPIIAAYDAAIEGLQRQVDEA